MPVSADISRTHMRDELALVKDLARTYRWGLIPSYQDLSVLVTMYSHDGDLFIVRVQCDNYKEMPPFFEFIDPDTGELGTRHAYPRTSDGLFHESGPCICAPFSRKAYKSIVSTGPHGDWNTGDWMNSTANNVNYWGNYSTLGDMIGLIQTRMSRPDLYKGRMG